MQAFVPHFAAMGGPFRLESKEAVLVKRDELTVCGSSSKFDSSWRRHCIGGMRSQKDPFAVVLAEIFVS
jgi:hypothetical protein